MPEMTIVLKREVTSAEAYDILDLIGEEKIREITVAGTTFSIQSVTTAKSKGDGADAPLLMDDDPTT